MFLPRPQHVSLLLVQKRPRKSTTMSFKLAPEQVEPGVLLYDAATEVRWALGTWVERAKRGVCFARRRRHFLGL